MTHLKIKNYGWGMHVVEMRNTEKNIKKLEGKMLAVF